MSAIKEQEGGRERTCSKLFTFKQCAKLVHIFYFHLLFGTCFLLDFQTEVTHFGSS